MFDSVRNVQSWNENQYLVVRPSEDDISLFDENNSNRETFNKIAHRSDISSINCFDYCKNKNGLIATGLLNGHTLLFNIHSQHLPTVLPIRQSRPCNTASFNSNGLLATGLDKVRNDNCLNIWSIEHQPLSVTGVPQPIQSLLTSETILSTCFFNDSPNVLMVGTYKFLREIDIRSPSTSVLQCPTKSVLGLEINPLNNNYFMSHAEEGSFSIWDRRQIRINESQSPTPVLHFTKFTGDYGKIASISCFRFSEARDGEFATLSKHINQIRHWRTEKVPIINNSNNNHNNHHNHYKKDSKNLNRNSQDSNSINQTNYTPHTELYVEKIHDTYSDIDRIVSFDFQKSRKDKFHVKFVCLRPFGDLFSLNVTEPVESISFSPSNNIAISNYCDINFEQPKNRNLTSNFTDTPNLISDPPPINDIAKLQLDDSSTTELQEENSETDAINEVITSENILENDLASIIKARAIAGYGSNCRINLEIIKSMPTIESKQYICDMWQWISETRNADTAGTLRMNNIDFTYKGVLGAWKGKFDVVNKRGMLDRGKLISASAINRAVADLIRNYNKRIFVSPSLEKQSSRVNYRKLALIACGWPFGTEELEEKLTNLEKENKHEIAAGWAVFHGNIARAVSSLASSKKESLRLISAAVSGYFAYSKSSGNNVWKEQCRKMSLELENPYIRAIFAYIADSDWRDVLDETSLPIKERIGIALRFLPDEELNAYLDRLCEKVIKNGELDGLILTGISLRSIDLLQSYIDRSGDIQTVAIVLSYCVPRYFMNEKAASWFDAYRNLLDRYRLFYVRAKFDVERSKLTGDSKPLTFTPRQMYLRCTHCNKIISMRHQQSNDKGHSLVAERQRTKLRMTGNLKSSSCPFCGKPLPRCAVCLRSLGAPTVNPNQKINNEQIYDQWFNFCLSCNHGTHAGHAKEWFMRHQMCPVPGCKCDCAFGT